MMILTSPSDILPNLRKTMLRIKRNCLDQPSVPLILECGGAFLLGGALAWSRLGGFCAPFGLGLVAAAGAGPGGFCALLGASIGYLAAQGLVTGLRYVSTAILIYSVSFAFYDMKIYRQPWFIPLCSFLVTALTGMLYFTETTGNALALPGLPGETVLVGLSAWVYRGIIPSLQGRISAWRREGALLYLVLTLSLAASARLESSPWLTAILFAAAWVTVRLALIRSRAIRARDRPASLPKSHVHPLSDTPSYSQRQLQQKLAGQSKAFQTLYEDMRKGLGQPEPDHPRLEQVFDRAAEQVCQDCIRYPLCWKQDYHDTYQAFRQMLNATRERGYGKFTDAPAQFQNRCSRGQELVSAANVEYASLLHRRQLDARLRASRAAVWHQYSQLAQILDQAARELENDLTPDPEQAQPVLRFLRRHGLEAEVRLGRDKRGRLVIQLTGADLNEMREGKLFDQLCKNMGMDFARSPLERDRLGQRMTLVQEDKLQATAGVAALSKEGQKVSGDGGNWFRDKDGCLWVVLCDGMGSGPGAAHQSRLALKLLEDFLRAGVSPELALATLSNALALRGEQELGFTTIDLLGLDLFSGQCRSYKLGAAPTYVRQSGRVKKISGVSLPAGLEFGRESRPDMRSFQISKEDLIVLISDGITDGEGDDWVWQQVRDFRGESPRELAHHILEESAVDRDDRTVIVLQIKERTQNEQKNAQPKRVSTGKAG
ncbi:MAG: SpoIIE family protein phosphatase [Oscillospiraceae bacterium]|nr:SpoIIE family protein phosphatase [Oscillospiraceae bacterium]